MMEAQSKNKTYKSPNTKHISYGVDTHRYCEQEHIIHPEGNLCVVHMSAPSSRAPDKFDSSLFVYQRLASILRILLCVKCMSFLECLLTIRSLSACTRK